MASNVGTTLLLDLVVEIVAELVVVVEETEVYPLLTFEDDSLLPLALD